MVELHQGLDQRGSLQVAGGFSAREGRQLVLCGAVMRIALPAATHKQHKRVKHSNTSQRRRPSMEGNGGQGEGTTGTAS